jgi:Carboxypeptidase regulatory-like domain
MVAYSTSPFKHTRCRCASSASGFDEGEAARREARAVVCSLAESGLEDAKILDSMDQALRAPRVRALARMGTLLVGTLTFFLGLGHVSAQLPLDTSGLRGGRYVGSAAPVDRAPRAVLGLGYAYSEGVLDGTDSHQRVFGEAAAGWAPRSYLQLSLGFDARYDKHSSDRTGSDSGGALGTRVATRHAFQLDPHWAVAARTALRFPPAASVSRGFRGISPEFGAIGSYLFGSAYELSVDLGFRIDRSEETVSNPLSLRAGDRLAASISRYDAALLGALFAIPVGPLTASAEWSWDVMVGSGAPSPLASPMRVRLAAQTTLRERFIPGVELGISPSARPDIARGARIEPRFWFALTCGVSFAAREQVVSLPPPAQAVVEAAPEPALVEVQVVDPVGSSVSGAAVQLSAEGEHQEATTGPNGSAELPLTSGVAYTLGVLGDGFEAQTVTVQGTPGRQVVKVALTRVLPEGEIKGNVRSLRGGQPVRAKITVMPLDRTVDTDAKGNFAIDVPPGQYSLEIEAPGFEPQTRAAQVERLGVTILVVDLRRATK